jgi:hypothetical protein
MVSASSALTSTSATDDDRLGRLEESQRHLVAGIAAVQQLLPDWRTFAGTTRLQKPARFEQGRSSGMLPQITICLRMINVGMHHFWVEPCTKQLGTSLERTFCKISRYGRAGHALRWGGLHSR